MNKFLLAFLVLAVLSLGFLLRTWQEREGTKHSIPLGEIKSGGPPKDGIPSIDKPNFISIKEAEGFLKESDPGIAINIEGEKRFYPFKILVWHEIVNDMIKGKRVLVTYCPLCLTGIVFDPVVKGERVEFGVSGKLWNSNLLMYDRKTDSLWSQVLGEAVVGEMVGTKLAVVPSDIIQFGNQILIIAVDRQEPLEVAKKYTDEVGVTNELTFVLDPDDSFYRSIGGFSMPETIFVSREGIIKIHKRGQMSLEEIREKIRKII